MRDRLEIKNLSKKLGSRMVLRGVSFSAETGDLIVLTGENGSGKTTMLRLLAGLSRPTGGAVLWNGSPYGIEHGSIGYVAHQPMLYDNLTVWENMQFFANLYDRPPTDIEGLLRRMGLWVFRHELAEILSRGMQQRLALARVLLMDPKLILYDEPFTGLDSAGQELLREALAGQKQKTIQIVVSHTPHLMAGLSFRHLKLADGKAHWGGVS